MVRDIATLLPPLARELAALGCAATGLRPLAAGLEFAVYHAVLDGRPVVVKTPWSRHIANDNDPDQDARNLLAQEAALLRFAHGIGVPAPEVELVHVDGAVDLIVTAFVHTDASSPDPESLAAVLARLHAAPAPTLPLVAQPGGFVPVVVERIARRAGVVERLAGIRLGLPPAAVLAAAIGPVGDPPSLLHLDVRQANLLTARGRVVGLIDWTNAMVGDPAFELARIDEYASAPAGFTTAYARHSAAATITGGADGPRELVYRLDTAVMLAVVFLSEAPDREQATRQLERVLELSHRLRDRLDG
jgi:aminoglycoside phosphotransferase (APT) family kinase protein